jgi:hypothetical protein
VQSQVFTIINDDSDEYYYPNLIAGMITEGNKNCGGGCNYNPPGNHGLPAQDMAIYTGSTTGTTRDNGVCSRYTPITWQVDRRCHLISARSFDKMCADLRGGSLDTPVRDVRLGVDDVYPHGARALVWQNLTANNQQSRE